MDSNHFGQKLVKFENNFFRRCRQKHREIYFPDVDGKRALLKSTRRQWPPARQPAGSTWRRPGTRYRPSVCRHCPWHTAARASDAAAVAPCRSSQQPPSGKRRIFRGQLLPGDSHGRPWDVIDWKINCQNKDPNIMIVLKYFRFWPMST